MVSKRLSTAEQVKILHLQM